MARSITAAPPGTPAKFVIRDQRTSSFFTKEGIVFSGVGLPAPGAGPSEKRTYSVQWGLEGAEAVEPRPQGERAEHVNTYFGDQQSRWTADQKSYSSVEYEQVKPGIDLKVESQPHAVKYTLEAAPAADVSHLEFHYAGAQSIQVNPEGTAVEIGTEIGSIKEDRLVCYQMGPGGRTEVPARYVPAGPGRYAIEVGEHDSELPLTIDPVISWSTYWGGSVSPQGEDDGYGIAADNNGNVYVTGYTYCIDFPATFGLTGGPPFTLKGTVDGFLIKLNPSGTVAWATYIGGSSLDYCTAVAVDPAGSAVYVTGYTGSGDFPTTTGAYDTNLVGYDAFVMKFASSGSLSWSTFLGGNSSDFGQAIALDSSLNVYVAGYTYSTNFPIVGGFKATASTLPDGFVAKINPGGTALVWSSYLGGNNTDVIYGLAVDTTGAVYATGYTYSTDFPVSAGLFTTIKGTEDAFLTKINPTGATLAWSTYLGGTNSDYAYGVCVTTDAAQDAVVTGYTFSSDYPTTVGAYRTAYLNGETFVTRVKSNGSGLAYSTFLGGSSSEYGQAIAAGPSGTVYVTGYTYSSDFPMTAGAYRTTPVNLPDGFVTRINAAGNGLDFSSYVGGTNTDIFRGIAVVNSGAGAGVYLTGTTYSTDFTTPITTRPDPTLGGLLDAFAVKMPLALNTATWSTYIGGKNSLGDEHAYGVAVDPTSGVGTSNPTVSNVYITGYTISSDFPTLAILTGSPPAPGPAYQPILKGNQDVFLSKISTPIDAFGAPTGPPFLAWSTYLGGSSDDYAFGISVDTAGFPYVVGYTLSFDFPVKCSNASSTVNHGAYEGFVSQFDPTGGTFFYSVLLGGSNSDFAYGIAIDGGFNAFVTGYTYSSDFLSGYTPVPGAVSGLLTTRTLQSTPDAFVVRLDSGGGVTWWTYLGGNNTDYGYGIAVNKAGTNCYVTGQTYSSNFPATVAGATTLGGSVDAFVTAFGSSNTTTPTFRWSRYLGGTNSDYGQAIAVDPGSPESAVYATGYTYSTDFPITAGTLKTTMTGSPDVYVTRLDPNSGSHSTGGGWSTYLGGFSYESAGAIAVDANLNAYITGFTYSSDFPTKGAVQPTINLGPDAFITKIYSSGTAIAWSSFLGGSGGDYGTGVAVDQSGVVYVGGYTYSADFPFVNALKSTLGGQIDAFLVRLDNANPDPPDLSGALKGQFRMDGTTKLNVGDWTNEPSIIVKAKLTDSDDDQVQLQVEIKRLIDAFDGTTNLSTSAFVPSGSIASVTVPFPFPATTRYHWQVRAIDNTPAHHMSPWVPFGGNSDVPPAARDVGFDQTPPAVAITTPTNQPTYYTTAGTIGLSGTATDADAGVVSVSWSTNAAVVPASGAAAFSAGTWSVGSVSLVTGSNVITINATDAAGNVGTTQITVYLDTTAPTLTAPNPPNNFGSSFATNSGSASLSGAASDNLSLASVTWSNNRGGSGTATFGGGSWNATITGLSPGSNVITITAMDSAGNSTPITRTIFYDIVPPTLSVTSPASGVIVNSATFPTAGVPMTGTASDNVAVASVQWKNLTPPVTSGSASTSNAWANWNVPAGTITLQPGANTIQVLATDTVGNPPTTASFVVYRDTAIPTLSITSPVSVTPATSPGSYTTGTGTVDLSGTCSDDISVKSITWANVETTLGGNGTLTTPGASSTTWNITGIALAPDVTNHITVTVTDQVSKVKSVEIDVFYNTHAPAIVVTKPATNPSVTNQTSVDFKGLVSATLPATLTNFTFTNTTNGQTPLITGPDAGGNWSTTVIVDANKTNLIQIAATDSTTLTTTVNFSVICDTNPPTVKIQGPTTADTYFTGISTLVVSGTASDDRAVTQVTWSTNGVGAIPASGTCLGTSTWTVDAANPIPLIAGLQTITITASDQAGNTTSATLDVTYDPTLPTISITTPSAASTFVTTLAAIGLGGSATDNVGLQDVTWVNAATGNSGLASGVASWNVSTVALNPGANPITVIATDLAGNIKSATITIYCDTQAPTVAITLPASGGTFITSSPQVALAGVAGDDVGVATVTWSNAGTFLGGTAGGTTTAWSIPTVTLAPGPNLITITATDLVGKNSTAQLTVLYDGTGPSVAITSPTGSGSYSTASTPLALSGTQFDLVGASLVHVDCASVTWTNANTGGVGAATITPGGWSGFVPLATGTNLIQVTATDAAGNFSQAAISVVYDPSAPQVAITTPTTGLTFDTGTAPAILAGTASDAVGLTSVSWTTDALVSPQSGVAIGTNAWSASVPLAQGANTITVTATNVVGTIGTSRITITYDPTPPTIAITNPTSDPVFLTTISPISIGGSAADNLSLQSVKWANTSTGSNGTATGLAAWTVSSIPLIQGDNVITVTATDGVGNSSTATITVKYDNTPPTLSIDPPVAGGPPFATSTRPLLITGTAGDNIELSSVTWTNSLGGGGTAALVGSPTSVTWSASIYFLTGDNIITVTATDAHGLTTTQQVTITFTPENVAPTISITTPTATGTFTAAGQSQAISGIADDNVAVVSVTWVNQATGVQGTAVLAPIGGSTGVNWSAIVPLTNGTNVIVVSASDDAGNKTPSIITITYTSPSDAVLPAVTITAPGVGVYSASSSPIVVVATATDNIGVASVSWTNAATGGGGQTTPGASNSWSAPMGLAQGANTITFTATDPSGNTATDTLVVNFVPTPGDVANPVVTITSYPTNVSLDVSTSLLNLAGTASDNVQVAEVVWFNAADNASGDAVGTDAWTASLILHPGVNVITMRAFDTSGNTSTDQLTVFYTPPPPPPPPPVHIAAGACGLLGLEVCLPLFVAMAVRRRRREGKGSKR
jgi:hypothetical protein